MEQKSRRGGAREGAGRPKGALNRRSIAAIEAVAERWPDWSPLEHFATVANDETLEPEIRLDAAKAAAPFIHAKLKQVVADMDEVVELEARIAAARLQAQADVVAESPGLADRLMRVMAQLDAETPPTILQPVTVINAAPQRVSRSPKPVDTDDAKGASEPPAGAAPAPADPPEPVGSADAAIIGATPPTYQPVIAWPEPTAQAQSEYDVLGAWGLKD